MVRKVFINIIVHIFFCMDHEVIITASRMREKPCFLKQHTLADEFRKDLNHAVADLRVLVGGKLTRNFSCFSSVCTLTIGPAVGRAMKLKFVSFKSRLFETYLKDASSLYSANCGTRKKTILWECCKRWKTQIFEEQIQYLNHDTHALHSV